MGVIFKFCSFILDAMTEYQVQKDSEDGKTGVALSDLLSPTNASCNTIRTNLLTTGLQI